MPCCYSHRVVITKVAKNGEIAVPAILDGTGTADPYMRWFGRGIHFGDDPDRTKFSYRPPRVLIFRDYHGTVVLSAAGRPDVSDLIAGVDASSLTLRSWVAAARGTNR